MGRHWWKLLLALVLVFGCEPPREAPLVTRAQFGVFFGGQVQEREEIPLDFDRSKQLQGFVLEFREPLPAPVVVKWEIDMPGTGRGVRDAEGRRGKGRLTKLGQAEARVGTRRFDMPMPFVPGDSIGTWNIRVTVDGRSVIDRPFLVYDAAARRRAERKAAAARRAALTDSDDDD